MVTGSRRGIGHAVSASLLRDGLDVIGVIRSEDAEEAHDLDRIATEHGVCFTTIPCDLSNRDEILDSLLPRLLTGGTIDVLVHAAGVNRRGSVRSFALDDWDEVMAVNLDAAFILARGLGDAMASRGSGHIVFLASMLSFQGGLAVPAYAASKGAIAQLTKSFANELAHLGVNVNAIAPGYVETDMNTALLADPVRSRQIIERIPAGRWGLPDDIADVCSFLVSPKARYVHGAVVPVDGGWLGR